MPASVVAIQFGPYRVHPIQGLSHGDDEIRVTPKSLAVLYELARRPGQVVTKAELFEAVWPDRVVTDAALSSCIRELRLALDDNAREPRLIETVYRRGFRLIPVRLEAGSAASGHAPSPLPAAAAVGVGAAFGTGRPHADSGRESSGAGTTGEEAEQDMRPEPWPQARAQPSIVVLPFDTIDADESSVVIARGLVHDIITRVARSRMMFIIARGTAFQFVSGRHDVARIGRKLGVRYVVQGTVQKSGRRLKVAVSLANASTRRELWSDEYRRSLDDFMLIQEEIAETIVGSLETEVQREEIQRSLLMPSSNLDAWSAYHRGIHHMYRFTLEDCAKAEQMFLRSVEMEPNVPRPYAGLSFINFERVFLNFERDRASGIQRAVDYALESLSIDPMDPMGHWALSRAYLLRGELKAAKESLESAIDLNPQSYAIAQYSLGWVGLQLGENRLCLDRVGFARRLSPYDPLKFAMLGVYALNLALMGRTTEAAALSIRSTLQPNTHHQALAFAAVTHALDGQTAKARAFFGRIRDVDPSYDVDNFLAVFPFQLERDIRRVRQAFDDMRPSRAAVSP